MERHSSLNHPTYESAKAKAEEYETFSFRKVKIVRRGTDRRTRCFDVFAYPVKQKPESKKK